MNQQKFEGSLKHLITTNPVDIEFLSKWFDSLLDQVDLLASQRNAIKHPRYRGDTREHDFKELLSRSLPPAVSISNGFVVDEYATASYEQDCLLLDPRQAATLVKSEKAIYYPIDSVLASIEIKSELTLAELRKVALNCVSLKKLQRKSSGKKDDGRKIAYFVFAYSSKWSLEVTCAKVKEVFANVTKGAASKYVLYSKEGISAPEYGGCLDYWTTSVVR